MNVPSSCLLPDGCPIHLAWGQCGGWLGEFLAAHPAGTVVELGTGLADGVLPYLTDDDVTSLLARIARRFPGALLAFDTYSRVFAQQQHKMAAKRNIAFWQWACDDPRTLERFGLRVLQSAAITRPPRGLRARLPARYRYLLPLADPIFGKSPALTLFRAGG